MSDIPPEELFKHEPIDLGGPSLRLLRLLPPDEDDDDTVCCEVFQAWIDDFKPLIPYEALSYTWGDGAPEHEIQVNGQPFFIRWNLYCALNHLRLKESERVIWADAISIDQDNVKERGHQVQLMSSIFKTAEHVLFWLGTSSWDTDIFMDSMQLLQQKGLQFACKEWTVSDERWENLWTDIKKEELQVSGIRKTSIARGGFRTLIQRSWWRRIWILQEVAFAKNAFIICGTKSISARIFATASSVLEIEPDLHVQAVIDIFPGPSRRDSWWIEQRDLFTLLLKFRKSQASDKRDMIYAVLGMSSDACDTTLLRADYTKTEAMLVQDTLFFFIPFSDVEKSVIRRFGNWTLEWLLENLEALPHAVFGSAVMAGDEEAVKLLMQRHDMDVNSSTFLGKPPLLFAMEANYIKIVSILVKDNNAGVNVNAKDILGQTALLMAIKRRDEKTAEMLLSYNKIDAALADNSNKTPLSWAAELGLCQTLSILLDKWRVYPNSEDKEGLTPLFCAVKSGQIEVIRILLGCLDVLANTRDHHNRTPLSWAARQGNIEAMTLLLDRGRIHVNARDVDSRTPLFEAVESKNPTALTVLLDLKDVNVSILDRYGHTPLSYAVQTRNETALEVFRTRWQKFEEHLAQDIPFQKVESTESSLLTFLLAYNYIAASIHESNHESIIFTESTVWLEIWLTQRLDPDLHSSPDLEKMAICESLLRNDIGLCIQRANQEFWSGVNNPSLALYQGEEPSGSMKPLLRAMQQLEYPEHICNLLALSTIALMMATHVGHFGFVNVLLNQPLMLYSLSILKSSEVLYWAWSFLKSHTWQSNKENRNVSECIKLMQMLGVPRERLPLLMRLLGKQSLLRMPENESPKEEHSRLINSLGMPEENLPLLIRMLEDPKPRSSRETSKDGLSEEIKRLELTYLLKVPEEEWLLMPPTFKQPEPRLPKATSRDELSHEELSNLVKMSN